MRVETYPRQVRGSTGCPCEPTGLCNPKNHQGWKPLIDTIPYKNSYPCIDAPSLYLFFRTVLASSELADLVTSLSVYGHIHCESVWASPEQTELSIQEEKLVRKLLRDGPRLWEDRWIHEFDKGTPDVYAAALILCLPNLEQLRFDINCESPSFLVETLLRNSIFVPSTTPGLSKLRTVEFGIPVSGRLGEGNSAGPRYARLDALLSFFYLPSIRRLTLVMPDQSDDHSFSWPAEPPIASGLETLELSMTHFPPSKLRHLLEVCTNLKSLKYDFCVSCSKPLIGFLDLQQLERSLKRVKDTLEAFHLRITVVEIPGDSFRDTHSGLISFREFPKLRILHVPLVALTGQKAGGNTKSIVRALPKCLEHLQLNDDEYIHRNTLCIGHLWEDTFDDAEVVQVISDYVATCRHATPNLKTLTLLLHEDQSHDRRGRNIRDVNAMEEALAPLCDAEGIKLTILKDSVRPGRWEVGELEHYEPFWFTL